MNILWHGRSAETPFYPSNKCFFCILFFDEFSEGYAAADFENVLFKSRGID